MADRLLRIKEVCQLTALGETKLREMVDAGKFPRGQAGGVSRGPLANVRCGGVDLEPAGRDGRRLRLIGLSGLRVGPRPGSALAPGGGGSGADGDIAALGGTPFWAGWLGNVAPCRFSREVFVAIWRVFEWVGLSPNPPMDGVRTAEGG